MRELSVAEQRYQAVLAVIAEGRTVKEVAAQCAVSRQTLHAWLSREYGSGIAVPEAGRRIFMVRT
jgi:DNA-binding NarL/FixJ family response regulator